MNSAKFVYRLAREDRQENQRSWVSKDIETIAKDIVDAAFKVHKEHEPGLLETACQACHVYELQKRGHAVLTELKSPILVRWAGI